jgi:antitoxin (DNA-binding transcriptional repressor) of toxin-antitoxin stability system
MKMVAIEKTDLNACVTAAQADRIVVTRKGRPVALIVGVDGLDAEQVELGSSDAFWQLIGERRKEKTITRAELERELERRDARAQRANKRAAKGSR